MAVTYLLYGNDFEYDASSDFSNAPPAVNNPDLFSLLRAHGYSTDIVCLDAVTPDKVHLAAHAGILPRISATGDVAEFVRRLDVLTDQPQFAILAWNLIGHVEQNLKLTAGIGGGLTDQVARAYAIADDTLGALVSILERKGLLGNTSIVVYGDHGDDPWTHGFKGGMTHATEPYTSIVHVPLAIYDTSLLAGRDPTIASTIDIAPTCLQLLGLDPVLPFQYSGQSLIGGVRTLAYSQNFFANQSDNPDWRVRKGFSVADREHSLMATAQGLEFYAHRLDPGNHCNLLHFFDMDESGRLAFQPPASPSPHFLSAFVNNPSTRDHLITEFERMRTALRERIAAKRAFIVERNAEPIHALDVGCCAIINRDARDVFFGRGTKFRIGKSRWTRLRERVLGPPRS
jgi:hypothetical protein